MKVDENQHGWLYLQDEEEILRKRVEIEARSQSMKDKLSGKVCCLLA